MRTRTTIGLFSALLVLATGVIAWQAWSTWQLQKQLASMQEQLATRSSLQVSPPLQNVFPAPAPQPGSSLQSPPLQPSAPVNPPGAGNTLQDPNDWFNQDPFAMLDQMQQRMQQMMQGGGGSLFNFNSPGTNSLSLGGGSSSQPDIGYEVKPKAYVFSIPIPKDSSVEVNTQIQGKDLTIAGKVTRENKSSGQGNTFSSVQTQQFARTFPLPNDADPTRITNQTKGDKVIITLPKIG